MICQDPVGEIRRTADLVEDVAVVRSVRLGDCGHYGSLWFHPSAIINIPPGYRNINTTIQTPNGELVLITVSQYNILLEVE